MVYEREPRNKPLHTWSNNFQEGCHDHSVRKGQSFQQMVFRKLDIHKQKNEVGSLPDPIFKN